MRSTKEEEELIHKILNKLDQINERIDSLENTFKVNIDRLNDRFDSIEKKLN